MAAATLTAKGQVVIPAEIRARYQLSPGSQVEFVDEGGTIRLLVRRRVTPSEPAAGHGMSRPSRVHPALVWVMRGFYEAEPQSARRATRPGGLPSSRRSATTNSRSRRGHADRADAGAPGVIRAL